MGRRKADPSLRVEIRRLVSEPVWREMDKVIDHFYAPDMARKGGAHAHALAVLKCSWNYSMLWFAEKMSGAVSAIDTSKMPYLKPGVRAHKADGYAIWAWLHLIQGCYAESRAYQRKYKDLSPIKIWGLCMIELKQNEATAVVKGCPNNVATLAKAKNKQFRDALYSWAPSKQSTPTFIEHIKAPHTHRLIRTALQLKTEGNSFYEKCFVPWFGFVTGPSYSPGIRARYGVSGDGADAKFTKFRGNSRIPIPIPKKDLIPTDKPTIQWNIPQSDGSVFIVKKVIGDSFSKEKVWKKRH